MIKLAIKASLAKAGNNKLDRISTEEQEQERLAM
jgi:hypothetical protein